MLGAMAAVHPTFKESLESCLTQTIGVIFGALIGVFLLLLKLPHFAATGIGIILVITLYNMLHIHFSPSLPCFIVVMLCTTENIQPVTYALGRIWDTTIGLTVGLLVNLLIFPYDNSLQIRSTMKSLDQEILSFLEDMFDGDDRLPDATQTARKMSDLEHQMKIFSDQKLILHLSRQKEELAVLKLCERKAKELVSRMEILSQVEHPGRLNDNNRKLLSKLGAKIREPRFAKDGNELDIVTNYHVRQILILRSELLQALDRSKPI
jgi:uncharacterized membrane protein YgaE (UPF0421/DUF939 family)